VTFKSTNGQGTIYLGLNRNEYVQGVSGGIVNILGGGSMDCSE